MSDDLSSHNNGEDEIIPWNWQDQLDHIDSSQVQLGKGFLSCRPASWFPHFAAEWLPLAHSLSVEMRVLDCSPVIRLPEGLDLGYGGVIQGEPFAIFFDKNLVQASLDCTIPGSEPVAKDIILEYLARRFVTTLRSSWVGEGRETIYFDRRVDPFSVDNKGAINLQISLNGISGSVWLALGRHMVSELDGMWRRQNKRNAGASGLIQNKIQEGVIDLFFEVAQLAVPPSDIVTYTQSGTNIDLEIPVSNQLVVRSSERPLILTQMYQNDSKLCLETKALNPVQPIISEGMTRLSICLGKISIDTQILNDYLSVGALWDTGIVLSDHVMMYLNNEVIAKGQLATYQGRYALSVY
jgi:hypothetical protein